MANFLLNYFYFISIQQIISELIIRLNYYDELVIEFECAIKEQQNIINPRF